jgi:hypothetical protein
MPEEEFIEPVCAEDAVVDAYKPGVDQTLLIENLRLTPEERLRKLESFVAGLIRIRGLARKAARDA